MGPCALFADAFRYMSGISHCYVWASQADARIAIGEESIQVKGRDITIVDLKRLRDYQG